MTTRQIDTGTNQTTGVTELVGQLREGIIDITTQISAQIPKTKAKDVEQLQTTLLDAVTNYADRLSPESLYESVKPANEESQVIRTINILNNYKKHLVNAINDYQNESSREIEMTLFRNIIFEFDYVSILDNNFRDALTGLKTSLFSMNTQPFLEKQIQSLLKVINKMKNNVVNIPDSEFHDILDEFEDNFNLAGPLTGIKIAE